jgi:hypothetical protein
MSSGIVAQRVANALIKDAEATLPRRGLVRFKSAYGGLWVGGRATLTAESVCFHPNAVNRGVHTGSLDIQIPLPDIVGIEVLPAFVSSVITISTQQTAVRIRCFRANTFASQIARLAGVVLLRRGDGHFRMRLSGE